MTETPAKKVKHLQNGNLQDFWGGAAKGPLSEQTKLEPKPPSNNLYIFFEAPSCLEDFC